MPVRDGVDLCFFSFFDICSASSRSCKRRQWCPYCKSVCFPDRWFCSSCRWTDGCRREQEQKEGRRISSRSARTSAPACSSLVVQETQGKIETAAAVAAVVSMLRNQALYINSPISNRRVDTTSSDTTSRASSIRQTTENPFHNSSRCCPPAEFAFFSLWLCNTLCTSFL